MNKRFEKLSYEPDLQQIQERQQKCTSHNECIEFTATGYSEKWTVHIYGSLSIDIKLVM